MVGSNMPQSAFFGLVNSHVGGGIIVDGVVTTIYMNENHVATVLRRNHVQLSPTTVQGSQ